MIERHDNEDRYIIGPEGDVMGRLDSYVMHRQFRFHAPVVGSNFDGT